MKQAVLVILIVLGLYFLLAHRPPLPFNHEVVGLGTNHGAHSLFGLVFLVVGGFAWAKGRKKAAG